MGENQFKTRLAKEFTHLIEKKDLDGFRVHLGDRYDLWQETAAEAAFEEIVRVISNHDKPLLFKEWADMLTACLDNGVHIDHFCDYSTPLGWAAGGSNYELAKFLIDKGADPDPPSPEMPDGQMMMEAYTPPLHRAIYAECDELVYLLLESGADVNALDLDNISALLVACRSGRVEVVGWLLQRGADLSAKDMDNNNALQYCMMGIDNQSADTTVEILRMLARHGVDPDHVDALDLSGWDMARLTRDYCTLAISQGLSERQASEIEAETAQVALIAPRPRI